MHCSLQPYEATWTETQDAVLTDLCPQYRVIIHNDDVTPMFFVVFVLTTIFRLDAGEAEVVMWEAHQTGAALVGVYPLEQAEFLVDRAHAKARTDKYPLTFSYEPEE
jgi:ATP-dependent Clp protease adaptor protein ClpS